MKRRTFLRVSSSAGLTGTSFGTTSFAAPPRANKRERMLGWLAGDRLPDYTPAAFFLHFGNGYKSGPAAAQKHLEFFRPTDMDFVKIQFEQLYSRQEFLQKPADWSKLKLAGLDFYEPLLVTVRELVKAEKKNSLILMTLYSPFMCAGHCATAPVLLRHMEEDPEAVKKGLEILTESQLLFVRACIKEGVDGFYTSTQGGEARRFGSPEIFPKYIKPYDLVSMKEIQATCPFNILHVCDYVAPYANYDAYYDYPGHVVNSNTRLADRQIAAKDIAARFKRPFMGGLDRHGIVVSGTPAQLEQEIRQVVSEAPPRFILGADCTVEADTNWDRLRQAIAVAHAHGVGT
jgi:uroporphyrinogen decarboxylase